MAPVNFHPDPSVQHPCLIEILFKPQAHISVGQIKGLIWSPTRPDYRSLPGQSLSCTFLQN